MMLAENVARPGAAAGTVGLPWRDFMQSTFPWVSELDAEELETFIQEFAKAVETFQASGASDEVREVVDDWQATAELRQAPEVIAHLQRTDRTYVPWV